MTDLVRELNKHPLNQAALQRLHQLGDGPDQHLPALLHLAVLGLSDQETGEPSQAAVRLSGFQRTPRAAMRLVEQDSYLDPQEVLSLPLTQLADRVNEALMPSRNSE